MDKEQLLARFENLAARRTADNAVEEMYQRCLDEPSQTSVDAAAKTILAVGNPKQLRMFAREFTGAPVMALAEATIQRGTLHDLATFVREVEGLDTNAIGEMLLKRELVDWVLAGMRWGLWSAPVCDITYAIEEDRATELALLFVQSVPEAPVEQMLDLLVREGDHKSLVAFAEKRDAGIVKRIIHEIAENASPDIALLFIETHGSKGSEALVDAVVDSNDDYLIKELIELVEWADWGLKGPYSADVLLRRLVETYISLVDADDLVKLADELSDPPLDLITPEITGSGNAELLLRFANSTSCPAVEPLAAAALATGKVTAEEAEEWIDLLS